MTNLLHAILIETASWKDLGELRSLESECFGDDAWPLLDLISVLSLPGIIRLKAVTRDGKMVGFIAGERHLADKIGWITTLGVAQAYRKMHIGTRLLEECEKQLSLPVIRLCVRNDNLPALQMYEKAGYHHLTIWHAYYHDGHNAIVLEKGKKN